MDFFNILNITELQQLISQLQHLHESFSYFECLWIICRIIGIIASQSVIPVIVVVAASRLLGWAIITLPGILYKITEEDTKLIEICYRVSEFSDQKRYYYQNGVQYELKTVMQLRTSDTWNEKIKEQREFRTEICIICPILLILFSLPLCFSQIGAVVTILLDISIISLNTLFIAKNFGDHPELSDYGKKKAYEKEVQSMLQKGAKAIAGQKEPDNPVKMSEMMIEWYRKHKDEFIYEAVMEKLKKRSEAPVKYP